MSTARLQPFAHISNIDYVLVQLAGPLDQPSHDNTGDWGWEGDEEASPLTLSDCLCAISAATGTLCISHDSQAIILSRGQDNVYTIKAELTLEDDVTASLCLPLAAQRRSSHGQEDWTCVMLGLASGAVEFYTEDGVKLFSQIFHHRPISRLHCSTYQPLHNTSKTAQHEEFNILYNDKVLISVDGFGLYPALKAARNQVAKGGEHLLENVLSFVKYSLQGQESITDGVCLGQQTNTILQQMLETSFNSSITLPPQAFIADVATAITSKLQSSVGSSLGSWLGFGQTETTKPRARAEPAISLASVCGVQDKQRSVLAVSASPDLRFVALADNLNRILIIDPTDLTVLRIFKGYRDAQMGWLTVKDSADDRWMLCLVLYAPRRGLLEVWAMIEGDRVFAATVGKNCVLLTSTHLMLAMNESMVSEDLSHTPRTFLLDASGELTVVEIPLSSCLEKQSRQTVAEGEALRDLNSQLRQRDVTFEAVNEIVSRLQLYPSKEQALAAICGSSISHTVALQVIDNFLTSSSALEQSSEATSFEKLVKGVRGILKFYIDMVDLLTELPECNSEMDNNTINDQLELRASYLGQSVAERAEFAQIWRAAVADPAIEPSNRSHVRFGPTPLTMSQLFHYFELDILHSARDVPISHLTPEQRSVVSTFIFSRLFANADEVSLLEHCPFSKLSLTDMLCDYWLAVTPLNFSCFDRLNTLLSCTYDAVNMGPLVRQKCEETTDIIKALCLCLVAQPKQVETDTFDTVTSDMPTWAHLATKLSVFSSLQLLIGPLFSLAQLRPDEAADLIGQHCARESVTPSVLLLDPLVMRLMMHLPLTLSSDRLLLHSAWQISRYWLQQPKTRVDSLSLCMEYLKCLVDIWLQNGLCECLWTQVLSVAVRQLVADTTALPYDSALRLLAVCQELLDFWSELSPPLSASRPSFPHEDIWTDERGGSFAATLAAQPTPEGRWLQLHWLLVTTLSAQITFGLDAKPTSCFPEQTMALLFRPCHTQIPMEKLLVTPAVARLRKKFARQLITATVRLLPPSSNEIVHHSEYDKWVECIRSISDQWQISKQNLCEMHAQALCSWGQDRAALVVVRSSPDSRVTATRVLPVLGGWLQKNWMEKNWAAMDFLAPATLDWLKMNAMDSPQSRTMPELLDTLSQLAPLLPDAENAVAVDIMQWCNSSTA